MTAGRAPRSDLHSWDRIEALFEAALEQPEGAERAAFLDARCSEDADLRAEVEELLAADAHASGAFSSLGEGVKLRGELAELAERALDEFSVTDTITTQDELLEQIGPYSVLGVLGRGGMGVVYLGEDRQLGRKVAIKTLPAELHEDRHASLRLAREARILASFDHPNLATIYGVIEDEGKRYLVLEYIAGETLAAHLVGGPLALNETLLLLSQIAAGLEAAHQKGVVHRDLKPANVLITSQGQVKIVDFGIAKRRVLDVTQRGPLDSPDQSLTAMGAVIGTASYMSPEQTEASEVDSRTDIWAFGCVLWECLVGRRLFRGPSVLDTVEAIRYTHPPWEQLPELPVELVKLRRRCLQKDPRLRLRDIGDARIELEELRVEASGGVRPRLADAPRPSGRWRTTRRVAAALGLAALVVASFVLGRWQGQGGRRDLGPLDLAVPVEGWRKNLPGSAAISPQGDAIIYVGAGGLLRRELSAAAPTPLLDEKDIRSLFFSPDGEWVGAMVNHALVKLPALGGAPITITELGDVGVGASWGDDGHIVYAASWSSPLMRVDADGGEPEAITELLSARNEVSHRFPHVLPGGAAVVYVVKTGTISSFDETEIAVVDLDTGEQRTLLDHSSRPGYYADHLLFHSEGQLYAVPFDLETLELAGAPEILVSEVAADPLSGYVAWAVSEAGDLLYQAADGFDGPRSYVSLIDAHRRDELEGLDELPPIFEVAASPDQRKLVLGTIGANNSLWVYDIEHATLERVAAGQGNAHYPVWTPDSEWITFARGRDGTNEVTEVRADGSDEERLIWRDNRQHQPLSWSPDGELLLSERMSETGDRDLWLIPRGGEPFPLLDTPASERYGSFSPDGASLIYLCDESGKSHLYLQSFPAMDRKRRLTHRSSKGGVWAPDGRAFYFVEARPPSSGTGSSSIFRVPIDEQGEPGTPERMLDQPFELSLGGFAGERLVLLQRDHAARVDHLRLRFGALAHLDRAR